MNSRASTAGCHADLTRVGFGIRDKFRNRFGGNRWVYLHDKRRSIDACDRRDIANEIEIEFFVECCVDCIEWADQKKSVAVRCCLSDGIGAKTSASARSILNN